MSFRFDLQVQSTTRGDGGICTEPLGIVGDRTRPRSPMNRSFSLTGGVGFQVRRVAWLSFLGSRQFCTVLFFFQEGQYTDRGPGFVPRHRRIRSHTESASGTLPPPVPLC